MTSEIAHAADKDSRPSAVEWWLVAAVCLTGFALRAAWPSRLAVEHFDEGVYASNIFFLDDPQVPVYPDQHLYAPPLLPVVIQYAMILFGTSNVAAIAVNIFAGSLTVPLVWWVGRRWFGPTAGLASATLVALSDAHIFFCRTALTDVLLCFWLLAAVYFAREALTTRRRTSLFAAGALTGLAWWTKYSGWLPLAIVMAGLIAWRVLGDLGAAARAELMQPRMAKILRPLAGSLMRWCIVALVAFLVWLPWLSALQPEGGYAAVAANHRGYIVGLSGWWNSFRAQASNLYMLDAAASWLSPFLALVVCVLYARLSKRRCTWNALLWNRLMVLGLPLFCLSGIALGVGGALTFVAVGGAVSLFAARKTPGIVASNSDPRWLSFWMLAAWFAGLSVTIPLYAPYPRLMLPWLMVCWLGAGAALGAFVNEVVAISEDAPRNGNSWMAFRTFEIAGMPSKNLWPEATVMAVVLGTFIAAIAFVRGMPGWEMRTSLADLAPVLIEDVCRRAGVSAADDHQLAIYTYGEPALLFQLRRAGVRVVRPVQDLAGAAPDALAPKLPSFIVVGRQARQSPGFEDDFEKAKPRLELVGTYRFRPSNLVLLDRNGRPAERREDEELDVYQMR